MKADNVYLENWKLQVYKAIRNKRVRLKKEIFLHYCKGKIKCVLHKKYFPKDNPITDIRVLTIDHINGGGNKHRKRIHVFGGGSNFYLWLKKHKFPLGYRVICFNCQWMKRLEDYPRYNAK